MARRRSTEQVIFFPWERGGGGFFRGRGLARATPFVAAISMIVLVLILGARERTAAGIRATRATLIVVHDAVAEYRADHEGGCPASLAALGSEGYLATAAIDGWGRPLRLVCPGRRDPAGYELMSDGPDGDVGGLDRVE